MILYTKATSNPETNKEIALKIATHFNLQLNAEDDWNIQYKGKEFPYIGFETSSEASGFVGMYEEIMLKRFEHKEINEQIVKK